MKPLSKPPLEAARAVRVVLTDIDDSVTTEGVLTAKAYGALEEPHRAGFIVIPVNDRPAGRCDHIARTWPVDAVVGESGALYFRYERERKTMHQRFWASPEELKQNRIRLDAVEKEVLSAVPGCALASNQPYRLADLAIDFREDVPALAEAEVDRIVSIFEKAGARAKVSSIHVNGWFGDYDKLSMAQLMMRERYGIDLHQAAQQGQCVFAGDSPNDAPMFGYFPLSVGVANVLAFADRLTHLPRYITHGAGGAGFAELARHLLAQRASVQQQQEMPC
jgi:HAD superfamily hydrolase (TIGR01484 family)